MKRPPEAEVEIRLLQEALESSRVKAVKARWVGRILDRSRRLAMIAEVRVAVREYFAKRGAPDLAYLAKHVVLAKYRLSNSPKFALGASWAFTENGDTEDGEWELAD